MIHTRYGPGGYDPAAPDGNVVEQYDDGLPPPVDFTGLSIDRWTIPADATSYAVARYASTDPVWYVVNGEARQVAPVDGICTLEVASVLPGPLAIQVRAEQAVILAEVPA